MRHDPKIRLVNTLSIVSSAFLAPFALNNFLQGRWLLGAGAAAIVGVFVFNAWYIHRHGRIVRPVLSGILVPATVAFLSLSIWSQQIVGVLWAFPSILLFYMVLREREAWIVNTLVIAVTVGLAAQVLEPGLTMRIAVTLIIVSIFTAIFINVINDQHARLTKLAATDPLTGLRNRTTLLSELNDIAALSSRTDWPVSLLALDLDHFKAINDRHGHATGDDVLRAVADCLRSRCREIDRLFRLGGEEFLVALHGSDHLAAAGFAEDIRVRIHALDIVDDLRITVSIGVATYRAGESVSAWMARADEHLYAAKAAGRNRVNAPFLKALND